MEQTLSYKTILKFWIPLALMWIAMSLEMPVVNSIIARMSNAKENLAIFGVVFSISLIIEGPIIQMLSASNALSVNYHNYKKLSKFLFFFLLLLVSIHIICCIPVVFKLIARYILNLDKELIEPANISLALMLPWVPSIGYRRMWQGVLIRDGRTLSVTAIMVLRIAATFGVLFAGFIFTEIRGCFIAAISLSIGVMTGGIFAGIFARKTIVRKKQEAHLQSQTAALPAGAATESSKNSPQNTLSAISWKGLILFYFPLALTSFVIYCNRPIISAGITRGLLPLESLAAWPVIISFAQFFQNLPYSFQEAAITLLGDNKETNKKLKKLIILLGVISAAMYVIIIVTPLGRVVFLSKIFSLQEELISISIIPLFMMTLISLVLPSIAWLRAVNIKTGFTGNIAAAVLINLITVTFLMFVINKIFNVTGLTAAAASYTTAICAEAIYLLLKTKKN